ncbi:iron-containing redox enzyme family protein [Limnobacter parvus]|uniref:Iron-containing redox enzyme family protein n=1 Tax=Limnobacter parvus TaxID=2939690 RepID=A0ABT1XHZ9_9BURK|nr:iron-containing redox enzyme family protein [Limnobacter parvus]MCR2746892.1 iron-containing redox enzyme family protein [Limnobacter parvus]
MNTTSTRLEEKLELLRPAMQEAAEKLWSSPNVRKIYPLYLEQMHMVVRSGVSLMRTAALAASKLSESCAFRRTLVDYLDKHIEEEKGHDQWLMDDYEATGGRKEYLISKIPSCQVASMVGAQYYWIIHHHPVMIMGHIAALEINHPPAGFSKRLAKLTGFPSKAFSAIARHEVLDLKHKIEILDLIDQLNLETREEVAVGVSGLHTLQSGVSVLSAIRSRSKKNPLIAERVFNLPWGIHKVKNSS